MQKKRMALLEDRLQLLEGQVVKLLELLGRSPTTGREVMRYDYQNVSYDLTTKRAELIDKHIYGED